MTDIYDEQNMGPYAATNSIDRDSVYTNEVAKLQMRDRPKQKTIRSNSLNGRPPADDDRVSCFVKFFGCGRTNVVERERARKKNNIY